MTAIRVTHNAAVCYIERIDGTLTIEQATARITEHDKAIRTAADFGCHCIRLGNGAKLVLDGLVVVTVLRRDGMGIPPVMPGARDTRLDLAMLGGRP